MRDLIDAAIAATRESKQIEFKESFNPNSAGEWCELVKDIVAMANSGGGIIVFGLDDRGTPFATPSEELCLLDPADVANKISKYTGGQDAELEICELSKGTKKFVAFLIQPATVPLVFHKPGTYDIGGGKQKTAFGVGTVYFRHGAKSEPGVTDDLRRVMEKQLEAARKLWMKGVKRVTQAPLGSLVAAFEPAGGRRTVSTIATKMRAVNDPEALPVVLTRDPAKATGSFFYEEISEGIFDEINNVVDANRVLARGRPKFLLGPSVYYRIYAERQHVSQDHDHFEHLFGSAVDLYAPCVFWALSLPDQDIAPPVAELCLLPRNPSIHFVLRLAVLLGFEFCGWLDDKWSQKWKRHPQPPSFYWSFHELLSKMDKDDPRLIAARLSPRAQIDVPETPRVEISELLKSTTQASSLLSKVCLMIFEGQTDLRALARQLDFLAYGLDIKKRARSLGRAIIRASRGKSVGEPSASVDEA